MIKLKTHLSIISSSSAWFLWPTKTFEIKRWFVPCDWVTNQIYPGWLSYIMSFRADISEDHMIHMKWTYVKVEESMFDLNLFKVNLKVLKLSNRIRKNRLMTWMSKKAISISLSDPLPSNSKIYRKTRHFNYLNGKRINLYRHESCHMTRFTDLNSKKRWAKASKDLCLE